MPLDRPVPHRPQVRPRARPGALKSDKAAARAVDVPRSTLLRWHAQGLIQPAASTGGSRLWDVVALRRQVVHIRAAMRENQRQLAGRRWLQPHVQPRHPRVDRAILTLWESGDDFPPSIIARAIGAPREYVKHRRRTLLRRGHGPAQSKSAA